MGKRATTMMPAAVPGTRDRATVLTKAVLRAATALGLTQVQLGQVLGRHGSTISRMASGEYRLEERAKEWELAAMLVRLYRGLDAIMASDETSLRAWMQNPNSDLRGKPAERILSVSGLVDAVAYVDAGRAQV